MRVDSLHMTSVCRILLLTSIAHAQNDGARLGKRVIHEVRGTKGISFCKSVAVGGKGDDDSRVNMTQCL